MRSSSFSKATGLTRFRRVYVGASASSFHNPRRPALAVSEGPSCLFVGPIETASKEMLEALYRQARDSYYSGEPLILDDMFDKVELKLRLYGSKSVVKYPRCSLRRQSTYADAEEDRSLILALGSVWFMLFMLGASIFVLPTAYSFKLGLRDTFESIPLISNWRSPVESLRMANDMLFMGLGYLIGYPIASASLQALEGVWRNDLVALKGCCPNCGEEVFAFVKTKEKSRDPHRAQCHVCQCSLEYRTKVQQGSGRSWVYGRVYLVRRT